MEFATLGASGLIVSRLSLVTMTFGEAHGEGPAAFVYKVDQKTADRLVGQALEAGVNFFNSADVYADGQAEKMLGKALGVRRKDVVIATKAGQRFDGALLNSGLSRRHLIQSVEACLERLATDWIDVFLVHCFDVHTPMDETLSALDQLVTSGKVRYIGFSNWPAWAAAKAVALQGARNYEPFRAAEMYYSLVGRDLEHEVMPMAADAGVGIMVWSPLAGGFLSGKYTRENPTGDGGRLAGFDDLPYDRERGYSTVDVLKDIASLHQRSPAQVALAWLLSKPVASVIVGASRLSQLSDNLQAKTLKLEEDELARLDEVTRITPPYPNWFCEQNADQLACSALGRNG